MSLDNAQRVGWVEPPPEVAKPTIGDSLEVNGGFAIALSTLRVHSEAGCPRRIKSIGLMHGRI